MFACPQCSKEFTSQGSLVRHLQNHSQTARHVCNVCGVIFRRRDLLTRHMKLHDPTTAADSPPAEDAIEAREAPPSEGARPAAVSRKRCHTACNRCRDLKIKCDGQFPCTRCSRSRKACEFERPSGRISQMPVATEERSFSASSVSTDAAARLSLPSFSPGMDEAAGPAEEVVFSHGDIGESFVTPMLPWDSVFSELTPWPWLHESLFLSGDHSSMFGGPVALDPSFASDPFSELPLATLQDSVHHRESNPEQPDRRSAAALQPVVPALAGLTADVAAAGSRTATTQTPRLVAQAGGVPGPLSPPVDDAGHAAAPQPDASALKHRAVDELIALAVQASGDGDCPTKPSELWARATSDLVTAFGLNAAVAVGTNSAALEHFVKLYKEHFHQLWPLLPRRNINTGEMHPLLYLVLASIGAMYMGRLGSECGAFLHNAVRRRVVLPMELDDSDDNLIWLGQARLLVQVAALYFGQPRAFSYAQHLGALLAAQARRMYLFSATYHQQRVSHFKRMKGSATDAERLDMWLAIEERRRLAFGIFRGDTFTSVLLNTKPLVTLDEIGLEFPSCNSVYNGEGLDPRLALEMLEHDRTLSQDLRASDVYHVLLERDEMLPPLEPIAHEILLFGLQLLIWRFSRDRQLLGRLTGGRSVEDGLELGTNNADDDDLRPPPQKKRRRRDTFTSEAESLDSRTYQMADLATERRRLATALSKWERALPLAKTFARTEEDRSYVLSSLILYHLSYLRLHAPVEDIHQIHYRLADRRPVAPDIVSGVRAWAQSPEARIAVERVRSVWSLITQQTQLGRARSKFNFNAYVGLHHGAAILWAYNGARNHETDEGSVSTGPQGMGSSPTFSLHADKSENNEILKTFVDLFHMISPAQWSSFAEVTDTLSGLSFPTNSDQM